MKLSQWAKKNSYSYRGAFNVFHKGLIPNSRQLATGTIIIDEPPKQTKDEYNVVYARVSSSENKSNLDSQAERISQFCNAKGWIVNEIIKECASGLNDKRPKLQKILKENKASRIVVEHRSTIHNSIPTVDLIKTLLEANGIELIILND